MKKFNAWISLCAVGIVASMLVAAQASAASIAWVSFHSADNMPSAAAATAGFTQAPDVGYTQALTAAGHTVMRVVTQDAPLTPEKIATLNTSDLIIIGR